MKRVLPFDFTAEEMDRGKRMTFHPMSGIRFVERGVDNYFYDKEKFCHWYTPARGYYFGSRIDLPRISDGKGHAAGEPYPEHWKFDPWLGEALGPWAFLPRLGMLIGARRLFQK